MFLTTKLTTVDINMLLINKDNTNNLDSNENVLCQVSQNDAALSIHIVKAVTG